MEHGTCTCTSIFQLWVNPQGELNYVYCEVSKAGCTTWQHLLKRTSNRKPRPIARIGKYGAVHADDKHFRFMNIRHPFDRLLSAYRNTVRKRPGDRRGPDWPQLNYLSRHFNTSHRNLTLTQFLEFLASPSHLHPPAIYFDRHWDSYARSCKVCSIAYDFILRTETLAGDAGDVLARIGYPREYLRNFTALNRDPSQRSRTNNSPTDVTYSKHLGELANVSRELLGRVFTRFRLDFEAFGYHFDFDTNVATCAIPVGHDDFCC